MKMKKLVAASAVLSAIAGFSVPAAHAEVAATVGVSNMYYWRGFDLKGGAALIADVNVSSNGFIAGAWTSSGDEALGTEYDLYAGYSGSAGDFTYGVSVISYNYASPKASWEVAPGVFESPAVNPGDYIEVAPTLGYGPFKLTYYDAINADHPAFSEDYSYATAELNFEKFAVKYGQHMDDGDLVTSHLDLTYKYNEKLSFTVGKIVNDDDGAVPDDAVFVVNLSLPIL